MEPIALTLFVLGVVWTWDMLFSTPPTPPSPPKTPEQELGEALGKYLSGGFRVDEIKIQDGRLTMDEVDYVPITALNQYPESLTGIETRD